MALTLQTEYPKQSLNTLMPAVRMLPVLDKLKLIRMLAKDIEEGGDIFPFETEATYQFATPYDSYGAAAVLLEGLATYDSSEAS